MEKELENTWIKSYALFIFKDLIVFSTLFIDFSD